MSLQTALDNIHLRPCSRWGHTEYSLNYHTAYLDARVPVPRTHPEWEKRLNERFAIDFRWHTNDGLIDWAQRGRVTDMGHAEYASDGSDLHTGAASPFHSEEDVWAFDAVSEYGLPTMVDQVAAYERQILQARAAAPDQLTTGGYYRTLVSGAIAAFGWEMLLAAAANPRRLERTLDGFFRRTLFHMQAWAQTTAEVVIQHDDFVWTAGPFMHPDIYRQVIIPRYAALWKPLHAAGKKVLFCSDGNFTEFAADIVAAGADGLIFEPCNDFAWMAERFGDTTCLVGSAVDCRDLTFGEWETVQRDIDRTFAALQRCRGALVAVGNHLPANIPDASMDRYFAALLPRLARR
jgi:hypothetical protein